MNEIKMDLDGIALRVCETGTLVIGSGCAGFNAADWLHDLGVTDMMLITEGVNKGASRNTGSDKQTYYKLSIAAGEADSVDAMTDTLCGAGVHGDIALAEAASSLQSFFKLANLGVPFPTNEYGEFVGYKTDHDPRQRATSAGPLTSKLMTEALERSVREKGVPVVDGMQAVKLFADGGRLLGVLAIDLSRVSHPDEAFVYFRCDNAILATGGPACVYHASVYPESQTGMTGMAIDAGAELCNFSEWQYGLASTGFRWNVSGTYQQVLPRYIAVDNFGSEREFLNDYFDDPFHAASLVFLKGYQWPFDVAKIKGSSQIDMIVHHETAVLGNRVYMDFTRNPSCIDRDGFSRLDGAVLDYLKNSGALGGTPIERLRIMNAPAIDLYRDNGIDITKEPLGIAVCAQHCNGGLAVDANWQTSIEGLYAAGEAAGTFGVYRPGGSALNSAQVGSMRAARHISRKCSGGANKTTESKMAEGSSGSGAGSGGEGSGGAGSGGEVSRSGSGAGSGGKGSGGEVSSSGSGAGSGGKGSGGEVSGGIVSGGEGSGGEASKPVIPVNELKGFISSIIAGCTDAEPQAETQIGLQAETQAGSRAETYAETQAEIQDSRPQVSGVYAVGFFRKQLYCQKVMSRYAAHIRDEKAVRDLVPALQIELDSVFSCGYTASHLPELLKYRDMLLTQLALLSAVLTSGESFGSRGSALIVRENGEEVFPGLAGYRYAPAKEAGASMVLYTKKTPEGFGSRLAPARPVPDRDTWFETVWSAYRGTK
ncbi:MAG: FAD-binding protein [Clostridiales bacterium]|nr:FAD-binding protein [Clostridiales bacterium]